jgi:hypothetical protein
LGGPHTAPQIDIADIHCAPSRRTLLQQGMSAKASASILKLAKFDGSILTDTVDKVFDGSGSSL